MKITGILGGITAASTQFYDRTPGDLTQERFGGLKSPDLFIRPVDLAPPAGVGT